MTKVAGIAGKTAPTREIAETEQIARARSQRKMECPNPRSRTAQAEVWLPIGRVQSHMDKTGIYKKRSPEAAIFTAAVLEFIDKRLMRGAATIARLDKRLKVKRSDLKQAIFQDPLLHPTLASAIIPDCGVLTRFEPVQPKLSQQGRRRAKRRTSQKVE